MSETNVFVGLSNQQAQTKAAVFCDDFPGMVALAVFGAFIMNGADESEAYQMLSDQQRGSIQQFLGRKKITVIKEEMITVNA